MQIDDCTSRIGLCNQFGDGRWAVYLTLPIQTAGCKELFDSRMAFRKFGPLLEGAQATLQPLGPKRNNDRGGILFPQLGKRVSRSSENVLKEYQLTWFN